jgi:zinc protease
MSRINMQERAARRNLNLIRSFVPLLIVLVAAGGALADLPTGEEVMTQRIEALGGEGALARHHNSLMKGTMSVSGVDMAATIYSAAPNLLYTLFESEMIGKMESGCNGEVAWDMSTMQGASVKEGKELEKAIFQAAFSPELRWRERYSNVDVQAEEEIDGTACYKIVLTPTVGDTTTAYVDAETWLIVKTETVSNSDMGSISIVTSPSDYREVDGVKVPFMISILLMGAQEMTTAMESVEFNVEIPEGTFDLPAEIQELLAAEEAAAGE